MVSLIPGVISRNWQLKAAALAMAILLWTVPRFEGQGSQVLEDIPVVVQLSDPTWARVGSPDPATVSVTLSGAARDLFSLAVERPPVSVPVDQVLSGDTTVDLRLSWFRLSGRDGVVVEGIRPGSVALRFEKKEERPIPFAPRTFGDLPDGMSQAGPPLITPPEGRVYGAASRVKSVDSLRLVGLDLSSFSGPGPVAVAVDTTGLEGLDVLPLEVSVEIPTDSTVSLEFPDQTIRLPVMESDPQLRTNRTSVTLLLMGPRSLVEGVNPESLRITILPQQATLAPGQEDDVPLVVQGVPEFVVATVNPQSVRLIRPAGQ